jgi:hypothetical protein
VLSREPDPLRGTPLVDINNPGRNITLPPLTEGIDYWTIEARTTDGIDVSATVPRSFRVLTATAPRVTLIASNRPFTVPETARNLAVLRWTTLESVGSSRFVLSRSAAPSLNDAPLFETINPATQIALPRLEPGTYYWTIEARTADGIDISAPSTASFQVLPAPRLTLNAPDDGAAFAGLDALRYPGTLRWTSSESVGRSRLIISRTPDASRDIVLDMSDPPRNTILPRLPAGVYYWTIQAETPDGIYISAAGPLNFRILPIPLREQVQNTRPLNNTSISYEQVQRDRRIVFSWESVNGANAYAFMLAPVSNPREPVISGIRLPTGSYSIDLSSLYAGAFIWQVEAIFMAADGTVEQHGQVRESRFTIAIPPLSNPQLNVPAPLFGN